MSKITLATGHSEDMAKSTRMTRSGHGGIAFFGHFVGGHDGGEAALLSCQRSASTALGSGSPSRPVEITSGLRSGAGD
jgi:hypothetical protein